MERAPKILILVSHPVLADVTAYRLRLHDMEPTVLHSAKDLDQKLGESLPDLIMIDLDLADCDGMQITEKLASDEITSRIPVLCMSAEGDLPTAEQAYRAGAREFLVVPYDPIVLEDKVIRLVTESMAKQEQEEAGSKKRSLATTS